MKIINEIEAVTKSAEAKNAWANKWITAGLTGYQNAIASTHGRYSVGNSVTLADLCLVPQLYNARRFNTDLSGFKLLTDIEAHLQQDHPEEWKQAHPDNQPDNPDKK
jgi:glutathione S-transferase